MFTNKQTINEEVRSRKLISQKLVKCNAMLCKLLHYVNEATIESF